MAKRRRTSSAMTVFRPAAFRPPAPIIRIAAPRAPAVHHKKKHRRHSNGATSGSPTKVIMSLALGAAGVGFIEKQNIPLPTLPMIGRKGTIAVAAYFLGGKRPGIARDICLAASVLAAYEFTKEGHVTGDD